MKLLIFTQKVDKVDSNLGFFHNWIVEFAKQCDSVKVICLYKGEYDLPKNVEVFSLGKEVGVSSFGQMIRTFKYVFSLQGQYDRVFVHMNPIYLVLCGWYFKIMKIPVCMWYVHKSVDTKLKIATYFVKNIFTSAKESFQLDTNKVIYLGHGIELDILPFTSHIKTTNELKLVHIGRITQIKHIEIAIDTLELLVQQGFDTKLSLIGECETETDKEYRKMLDIKVQEKGLENRVNFAGGILHHNLAEGLKDSHIALNMTPSGGMDKVVLESIILGLPAFTANPAFTRVFGEYGDIFIYPYLDATELSQKIKKFISMSDSADVISNLSQKTRTSYGLQNLVQKVVSIMK